MNRPVAAGALPALLAVAFSVCAPADGGRSADQLLEDTLRARIEQAYDFRRPGVVERMSSLYPDSGRVISASGGHVMTTVDSLRQGLAYFWESVGTTMQDPRWQWEDVHVDRLADDAAALTGTWSIAHVAPTGDAHTIRGAWTAVFRRIDGEWKIVQEHLSVPPVVQ
jgi:ketosteroid isomerase-like protein